MMTTNCEAEVMGIRWSRRTVSVRAGEYTATKNVTEWVSEDGRFTITPSGSMSRKRERGIRGPLSYRWRWTGYRLVDHSADLPSFISKSLVRGTVAECKRLAAARLAS